jgi:hypothetical protein
LAYSVWRFKFSPDFVASVSGGDNVMGKPGWEVVGALLVTVFAAGPCPLAAIESGRVDGQEANTTASRIRTADPDIAQAIARAIEWSNTFRRLVGAIERTDGVVWQVITSH